MSTRPERHKPMELAVSRNARRLLVGNTGLPVESILGLLAAGQSRETLPACLEGLTARDIDECVHADHRMNQSGSTVLPTLATVTGADIPHLTNDGQVPLEVAMN